MRPLTLRGEGQAATLAALLALAAVAWVATHRLADPAMRLGVLTQPDGAGGMAGGMAMDGTGGMQSMQLGLFLATWLVMMVAMMLPAVAPVVLLHRRWARSRGRPETTTAAFVAGYLLVWGAVGLAAYAVLEALQRWIPPDDPTALRVGGALLAAAGLYQFSRLKARCLTHCRSPLGVVMGHGARLGRGHAGPLQVGVVHGSYCLGCCWSLMVVLLLLGMMNLVWMAAVAAVVLAEKILPGGWVVARVVGGVLALAGLAVVLWPRALPAWT